MYARAPLRISYGGGGTDLDPYRSEYGGVCMGVAIQKYAMASFGGEDEDSEIVGTIRNRMHYFDDGENINVDVDAPPFSGLGASGAISVSVIGLLANGRLDKRSISNLAFDIERNDMGIVGGFQDQIYASYGGMIYIEFGDGRFNILPMTKSKFVDELESKTLLVYMGKREVSGSQIEESWQSKLKDDILGEQVNSPNINALNAIKQIANEERRFLRNGDLKSFCDLLHESWTEKKRLSPHITNSKIENMYEEVHKLGASGKICGAGGGGYFLLVCKNGVSKIFPTLFDMGFSPERIRFDWEGLVVCQ